MAEMSDIERLVALEEIRLLKARRDQAIDTKNWELYHSLHAPHHVSHNEGHPRWEGPDAMIEGTRNATARYKTVHHSHTPDITFESPTKAKGIWGMEDLLFDTIGQTNDRNPYRSFFLRFLCLLWPIGSVVF